MRYAAAEYCFKHQPAQGKCALKQNNGILGKNSPSLCWRWKKRKKEEAESDKQGDGREGKIGV